MTGVFHHRAQVGISQLPDAFHQAEGAARRPCLTDGQLPAGGIEGKIGEKLEKLAQLNQNSDQQRYK